MLVRQARLAPALARLASSAKPKTGSPFALPALDPDKQAAKDDLMQRRKDDLEARRTAMTELLREKAVQEAAEAARGRRPEGISHVLPKSAAPASDVRTAVGIYLKGDEDGGPKGASANTCPTACATADALCVRLAGLEPTRFGDWERQGRTSDF